MDGVYVDNVDFNEKTAFVGVNLNTINFNLAILLQDLAITQQRVANLEKKNPVLAWLLRITCNYGRSFGRFLACCLIIIVVFAGLYAIDPSSLHYTDPVLASTKVNWFDALYFSTLSFITVGYDVQPASLFGKILAVIQGIIGYLMTGLLVAIMTRRTIGN